MKFIFFGTQGEAVQVLEILKSYGLKPMLIVTSPDRPAGRGLAVRESEVAVWARANSVDVIKPEKLIEEHKTISQTAADFAIVFAYGKIIPQKIIDIFPKGMLNIHPSLLPLYRGPSPVESAILSGDLKTGVSIMLIDSEMDHGPLIDQVETEIEPEELAPNLLDRLVSMGAHRLSTILPDYLEGKVSSTPQNHSEASYSKKISKSDGQIDLEDIKLKPLEIYKSYKAYAGWPGIFFFETEASGIRKRVVIKKARMENNAFVIEKVVPEGKRIMDYADYLRGRKNPPFRAD